jgi:hypothetical protein
MSATEHQYDKKQVSKEELIEKLADIVVERYFLLHPEEA